ncbi:hypothetical protein [Streptomyces sp. NPDC007905]|uniref:hypothetical protein n=1 Tax=Streptomyces sp. NPDC007905 TaxID=3364788 RepID=UPI0036E2CFC9
MGVALMLRQEQPHSAPGDLDERGKSRFEAVLPLLGTLLDGWPKGMRLIVRKERPVRREALLIRAEVGDLRR